MRMLWVSLALAAVLRPAMAEEGSVAVQTQPPQRGSVPALVVAYGTAAPALDGGMTLSLQQEGRVTSLAVTPGEAVHTGDRLMNFGVSAAASSSYTQAVTALDLAKTQRAHAAQLLAQQLATRDQVGQAEKALRDAQAALDALRREGGGKPVQTLTAPFDGIVSSIAVAQGDRLQPGAPLMVLTRLDGLVVTVGLDPMERAQVHEGDPASLQRLAGGPVLTGRVSRVDAVVNAKTRLVDADIAVPAGAVLSGETFRAAVTVGQTQGWIVPHGAVLTDDKGAYLFQVSAGKAARVDVTVAGNAGDTDVVTGPVDPSRLVIVQGGPQLSDGAAIREGNPPS
jgi:membrane fusion protein (multidrug efflux system)